ncbi:MULTISPECIES: hypothetical protein [unclassified Burkholderia]|uniref:hypothetical protein n=1 Tax=unclassified Burkholderia TaxID=2613784 RepID=UPI000A6F75DF|nr:MULTISPECIES: hypothetical protein [unclassified Burkholderia]
MAGESHVPVLEIEYLDYRFTATLETRETGRVAVLDRFLKRNDFADEDDARANIVDWRSSWSAERARRSSS